MKRLVPCVVCCAITVLVGCNPAPKTTEGSAKGPEGSAGGTGKAGETTIGKAGELYPVARGGKFGFIDSKGKTVIEPKYYSASRFNEDLALVVTDDPKSKAKNARKKCGYINREDKFVIEAKFDGCAPFSEGLATIFMGKKAGIINKKGDIVVEPRFERVSRFHDGLAAAVIMRDVRGKQAYDGGYINDKGKFVIYPQFDPSLTPFSEGVAGVRKLGQMWSFIDKDQKPVITQRYFLVGQFNEGVAPAMDAASKWGFVDKTGAWVISAKFQSAQYFAEGLCAVVNLGGKRWGFIDRKGTQVIPESFDRAEPFQDGISMVVVDKKSGYINKEGKYVVPLAE